MGWKELICEKLNSLVSKRKVIFQYVYTTKKIFFYNSLRFCTVIFQCTVHKRLIVRGADRWSRLTGRFVVVALFGYLCLSIYILDLSDQCWEGIPPSRGEEGVEEEEEKEEEEEERGG